MYMCSVHHVFWKTNFIGYGHCESLENQIMSKFLGASKPTGAKIGWGYGIHYDCGCQVPIFNLSLDLRFLNYLSVDPFSLFHPTI